MAPNKEDAKNGKRDLNELKRELELDEHKVPIDALYRRLNCDPVKVD